MSFQEIYDQICDWYAGNIEQLCKARPHDAPIYRIALARAREAKPTTRQEVEQRAVVMVRELETWGETMFPAERSRHEIQKILYGVSVE